MSPLPRSRPFAAFLAILLSLALGRGPATAAPAQASEETPAHQTVVYRPQHIQTESLRQILGMLKVRFSVERRLGAIVVHEPPERQLSVREVIAALDVPPEPRRDIELEVSILEASRTEGGTEVGPGLVGVADELAAAFGYRRFRALDSIVLRVSDGAGGQVEGGILFGSLDHQLGYRLSFREASMLGAGDGSRVRLAGFQFRAYELVGEQALDRAAFITDVEMAAGQAAVVGKATPWKKDATLVLVVKAAALP